MQQILSPDQILDKLSDTYVLKARASSKKLLILSFLAGAFIAFAAQGSTFASFNLLANAETLGLGKLIQGLIFTPGLIFVLIAGAELFTGNSLMIVSVLDKKLSIKELLRAWGIVYLGNFLGSVFVALILLKSGQWNSADSMLGARVILIANSKIGLSFSQALLLGVLCNWLVCLAVWMSFGSDSQVGKMLSAFFPVMLFVVSGFEHSIANMYYIPAGILAKTVREYLAASGLSEAALSGLNWTSFFTKNLIPVTLGNIIGGGIFVGLAYWLAFRKRRNINEDN
ncbi:formate/nitrite transporter family protein [uncultured Anaerococcus sp.]|uniref:formate/nitrite transporter family protein n=1 Tax=uncultured Anaerococcus sp. TaxID=293428 RepID=UPI00263821D7|nr:formate/nitrite transporter family protein [uncultured Anaerococcus sp.]